MAAVVVVTLAALHTGTVFFISAAKEMRRQALLSDAAFGHCSFLDFVLRFIPPSKLTSLNIKKTKKQLDYFPHLVSVLMAPSWLGGRQSQTLVF